MWDKKITNSKTVELSPTFQNYYKSIFLKKDNHKWARDLSRHFREDLQMDSNIKEVLNIINCDTVIYNKIYL